MYVLYNCIKSGWTDACLFGNAANTHISKTYYRSGGKDIVTTPKTEQSVRIIDIPNILKEEIEEYVNRIYGQFVW